MATSYRKGKTPTGVNIPIKTPRAPKASASDYVNPRSPDALGDGGANRDARAISGRARRLRDIEDEAVYGRLRSAQTTDDSN